MRNYFRTVGIISKAVMNINNNVFEYESDSKRTTIVDKGLDKNKIYTVIFVVNNKQQIDLFLPLHKYLQNFKILYVYLANWGAQKHDPEFYLSSLNYEYITIGNLFITRQSDSLFKKIHADIVVLGHDTNLQNQIIIKSAKKFNIPTLLIQDGIFGKSSVYHKMKKGFMAKLVKVPDFLVKKDFTFFEKIEIVICRIEYIFSKKQVYGRGDYSKIVVFGDATKKILESEGIDSDRIIITGSPKFDCLYNYSSLENSPVYQELKISAKKKTILLITQPFVESSIWTKKQWEEYISQIGMVIEKMSKCQLIIKIRQNRENIHDYTKIAQSYGIHPIICEDISLPSLIKISDVVITVSSTGGIETIAAEKPLIIFDPFYTPVSSHYNSGDILFLRNIDELTSAVEKIVSDDSFQKNLIQKQQSFLESTIFQNDGKAAERICNSIISIINNNNKSQTDETL